MKIKKGKKYRCVKWNGNLFKVGEIYESIEDGRLIDKDGDSSTPYFYDKYCKFKKVPSKKDLPKRIEALEKRLQPCETSAKFKAIADHANAISEIIKNAPE